jgi:hypothetical protein
MCQCTAGCMQASEAGQILVLKSANAIPVESQIPSPYASPPNGPGCVSRARNRTQLVSARAGSVQAPDANLTRAFLDGANLTDAGVLYVNLVGREALVDPAASHQWPSSGQAHLFGMRR